MNRAKRRQDPQQLPSGRDVDDGQLDDGDLEAEIAGSIARTLKAFRQSRGLTLQELANQSGLSLGMVSKLENAHTSPSLRTLALLSLALDVPVSAFFQGVIAQEDFSLVRRGQGSDVVRPGDRVGYRSSLLAAQLGTRQVLQPHVVVMPAGSKPYPHFQHSGIEFIYVLEGSLDFRYGSNTFELNPGDSLLIHGSIDHGPSGFGEVPVKVLSIIMTDAPPADSA